MAEQKNADYTNYFPEGTGLGVESKPIVMSHEDLESIKMGNWNSVFATSYHFAPFNPDIFISSKGYDEFEKMKTMSAVNALLNIKKYAILSGKMDVLPEITDYNHKKYKLSQELTEYCKFCVKNIRSNYTKKYQSFKDVLFQVLDGSWYGFSVSELCYTLRMSYGPFKGKVGLSYIAAKPPQNSGFGFYDKNSFEVSCIYPYTPLQGYMDPVPVEKVILYTYNPERGLPYGRGDARACWKHYYVLDSLIRFWGIAMERWGSPLLIIKYPQGNADALKEAVNVANKIKNGGSPIFPENVTAEFIKIDAQMFQGFRDAAEWNVSQIALSILGNSLTTSEGDRFGNGSLGKVHQQTQQGTIGYCRESIETLVTDQIFKRLVEYSYGIEAVPYTPHFSLGDTKPGEFLALSQAFMLLVNMGNMSPSSEVIRETLGLPSLTESEVEDIRQQIQETKKVMNTTPTEKVGKQEDRSLQVGDS